MVISEQRGPGRPPTNLDMSIGNCGGVPVTSSSSSDKKQHRLKQRFQVVKKLGQGTYGKVQLAINKQTGQEVAIKTIKKSKIESEQDLVRIRREIQIMSSIQHPHIIHIFEVFENKEKIVLVMQYASGGELYEYVSERKALNDGEARRLFRQIATAIYYCHKNKVCHRDLKLENILLDEKGNAKIADFGLSNVFDERHFLATFCGSPLYASPEIVKGTPYFGPEVDCWSMGVLLYTLVYGAMPFDGSNFKRLVKQISEASYFEPQQKSDASGLIKRLLAVNPTKRATIVDICTDGWVNQGFDNTLLQVAEDLANLTPVRLDILLALAPISPTDQGPTEPFKSSGKGASDGAKKSGSSSRVRPAPRRQEEVTDDSLGVDTSTTDMSEVTDIPSALEDNDDGDDLLDVATQSIDFLPSAVAAALEDQKREEAVAKRDASALFDQQPAMSRPASQIVQKKKKAKKSPAPSELLSPADEERKITSPVRSPVSDVKSSPAEVAPEEQRPKTPRPPSSLSDRKSQATPPPPPPAASASPVPKLEQKADKGATAAPVAPTVDSEQSNEVKVKSVKQQVAEGHSSSPTPRPKEEIKLPEVFAPKTVKSPEAEIKEERSTVAPVTLDIVEHVNSQEAPAAAPASKPVSSPPAQSRKLSLVSVISDYQPSPSNESTPVSRTSSRTPSEVDPGDAARLKRRHQSLERRLSTSSSTNGKRVGRLSIPNFMDIQEQQNLPKKQTIPSYGPISETKNKLLERKDSIAASEPENVFPTIPVSDAKKDVERRSSVADPLSLRKGPSGIRLGTDQPEEPEIRKKKVHPRSLSVGDGDLLSPRRVLEAVNGGASGSGSNIDEEKDRVAGGHHVTDMDAKDLAKEVLKKQLAKARLAEKRQASVDSLASVDSNNLGYTVETPDTASKRAPFARESSVKSSLEVSLSDNEPAKSSPITRSYKKVTFTKDGACVTETGKIQTTETPDGTVTRVEKKSKVTHYPVADGQANATESHTEESSTTTMSNMGELFDGLAPLPMPSMRMLSPPPLLTSGLAGDLRKSDSISSSGSTDILDDIFDTWTCDSMFSNSVLPGRMKSLFSSPFLGRRKTSRSKRAESVDRKDGCPPGTKSAQASADQESESEAEAPDTPLAGPTSSGLFKILRENSRTQARSLFSRFQEDPFGGEDPFAKMSSAFSSRLPSRPSRDSSGGAAENGSPEAGDFPPFFSSLTPRGSISSSTLLNRQASSAQRPYGRTLSGQSAHFEAEDEDGEDSVSARRRVEAWLRTSPDQELDDEPASLPTPMPQNIYATVRPRPMSRYARTMSGQFDDPFEDLFGNSSPLGAFPRPMAGFMPMRPMVQTRTVHTPSGPSQSRVIYQTGASFPVNEPHTPPTPPTAGNSAGGTGDITWDPPVTLPESSTLLQQLRAQGGYKNLVSQTGRSMSSPTKTAPGASVPTSSATAPATSSSSGNVPSGNGQSSNGSTGETVKERIHRKSFYRRIQEQC